MKKTKRMLKVMLTIALCAIMVTSGIGAWPVTSYAAGTKQPLSVNFCGTTVKLIRDLNDWSANPVKFKTVEKKWGKPTKKEQAYDKGMWFYTWKKGKSSITINNFSGLALGDVGGIEIEIKDKNASIYGVKVGMKKATALKKLEKAVGKEKVMVLKEGQQPEGEAENGSFAGAGGEAVSDKEVIHVKMGAYMPMQIELSDSGKVKKIYYMNS